MKWLYVEDVWIPNWDRTRYFIFPHSMYDNNKNYKGERSKSCAQEDDGDAWNALQIAYEMMSLSGYEY